MHLFHDSTLNTWKLITEKLPEKRFDARKFQEGIDKYNAAIAALKRDAIDVQNPEIGIVTSSKGEQCMFDGYVGWDKVPYYKTIKEGELYFWPGGYETKETDKVIDFEGSECYPIYEIVAILTLPEEKKNTMDNLTKEQAIAAMKEGKKVRHRHFSENEWMMMGRGGLIFEDEVSCSFTEFWQRRRTPEWEIDWSIVEEPTASGSVAAPKPDLETENERLRQAYDYILGSRNNVDKELNEANAELAAAKESLKELLPIAEKYAFEMGLIPFYSRGDFNTLDTISRAKALLDKQ